MNFNEIIGNELLKNNLNKIADSNKIAHSYIFLGKEGIGKKEIAKEFAKKILCLNTPKGCNNCTSCIEFEGGSLPDFSIISPDGKNIKIDQIRNFQSKVYEKPVISNKKVYIIDNADLMTKEAQNCLLKTLEEPPNYVVIILIVSNENKLLNTIKSRCIKIVFSDLSKKELEEYLQKNGNTYIDEKIISRADGSIRKLIHIRENIEVYKEIEDLLSKIDSVTLIDMLKKSDIFNKYKEIINEVLDYMNLIFFEKSNSSTELEKKLNYMNCIQDIEETKLRIAQNSNFDMSIDYLFLKIWEENCEKHSRS